MKKITAIMCSALMLTTGALTMVGCGGSNKDEATTVMNVSCNPEVEFVLDGNNKVVSVNALNEEGNLVVSAEVFTGKSAEEAAKLFVQVSKDTGFIVSGNASLAGVENEIEIEISGDVAAAEKLYNNVKSQINTYLTENDIQAKIDEFEAITKAEIEALVAECAPYLEQAEVAAMEYSELLATLAESRKETAEYYSQELKNAYYEAKAAVMEQAEIETLKEKVSGLAATSLEIAYGAYSLAVDTIEATRMSLLVNETSPYQLALKAFRDAKISYLNYRNQVAAMEQTEVTTAISEKLADYEELVEKAEAALLKAGEDANATLDEAKTKIKEKYENVVEIIEAEAVKVSEHLDAISAKQAEAKAKFFNDFESNYAAAITKAESDWAAMKTTLENKETAQA